MVYGMTAFARHEAATQGGPAVWEIRSVNHRFLEVQFRLPEGFRDLEHSLRERARATLKRGKVDCTLRVERDVPVGALHINRPVLLQLLAAFEQIRRDMPEGAPPSPIDVLRWPGVLMDDDGHDEDTLRQEIGGAFDTALAALLAHRQREGSELTEAIEERLAGLEQLTTSVQETVAGLGTQLRERLLARLRELDSGLDTERLEQEVVLLVQRADVAEELDRLRMHINETRKSLASKGPHGRRLDFVTQELNREANTLGSKSVLPETSKCAVDMKVLIEQIREQVQNIE